MATQNLFEKYGIKEVADVTFYRIEKKEETYESQREISIASIIKGAVETRTVYPLVNGLGSEEGFEAFVFSDASILTGTNYDCDDVNDIIVNLRLTYTATTPQTDKQVEEAVSTNAAKLVKYALGLGTSVENFGKVEVLSYVDESSNVELTSSKVKVFNSITETATKSPIAESVVVDVKVNAPKSNRVVNYSFSGGKITISPENGAKITSVVPGDASIATATETGTTGSWSLTAMGAGVTTITVCITDAAKEAEVEAVAKTFKVTSVENDGAYAFKDTSGSLTARVAIPDKYIYSINSSISFEATNSADTDTGIFTEEKTATESHLHPDADYPNNIGTHEYSYAQQVCILFARHQNLISKTGVRYQFTGVDNLFGDLEFNDSFTTAPHSNEKIVVVGLAGKFTEGTYDIEEINEYIKNLTSTLSAKAYDVVYDDYAELVVEDEMGYYRRDFLGYGYTRDAYAGTAEMDAFSNEYSYKDWVEDNDFPRDAAIANAVMWEDGVHYSINDAIEALRQKQLILDVSEPSGAKGLNSIFGGYRVSSKDLGNEVNPIVGTEDIYADGYTEDTYKYRYEEINGEPIESQYPLADVEDAVNELALSGKAYGKDIRVEGGDKSNRAIYIRVDGSVDTAAGAYIYLLHNKNYRRLATDKDGIFQFEDKKGNTLYYQDKIFKGVEWLALVILGNKGLIFVVNRHGNTDVNRVAWMVNESGYVDDRRAAALVKNGLIHTTDITANDETFEATCTVKSLKVRKVTKKTNHYIPVLYLDTLKVSTIEQTAEEVYATGGRGNANLIGWDYGKEITLSLEDALFTPASMSAMVGSYEGNDFRKGVKEVKSIDRMEKVTAKRSFIVPAGNMNGTPTEADKTAQAVFYDPNTMEPYADGTPIAEGEIFYKFTRSIAYEGQSLGHMIEISADKFPGTYKIVGDTFVRSKETGEDERFQFVIPQAKMGSEWSLTLEADGDPVVFDMDMTVLRPDDGVMVKFIQYNVVENEEENDGSTMVTDTENLNLLDDAELFKVSTDSADDDSAIGATEY